MRAKDLKVGASIATIAAILLISPLVGLTVADADEKQGVMLDFGYYDVEWVEVTFTDGMNGDEALGAACGIRGYKVDRDSYGEVYAVDGRSNLIGITWSMYVLEGTGEDTVWTKVESPSDYVVSGESLVSWARASSSATIMPGTDPTGFTYYSYSDRGHAGSGRDLRIVTMAPSVTETVVAVGGLDYIVATDSYSNYPAALRDRQADGKVRFAGGYTDPNYEIIVSIMPDIVFLDGSVGEHVNMADKLRKSGINCVVLYEVDGVSDMLKNMWLAASAIGFPERGNTQIAAINKSVDSVLNIAETTSQKVFIALSNVESPYTTGSGTYLSSMISSVGASNVFDTDGSSWFMVDKEQVYVKQPDVIVILDSRYDLNYYKPDGITTDPASASDYKAILKDLSSMWKNTPAYLNGKVFVFSGESADLLSRPGARMAAAMELMAKCIDPDSFIEVSWYDKAPNYFGSDYARFLKYQTEGMMV